MSVDMTKIIHKTAVANVPKCRNLSSYILVVGFVAAMVLVMIGETWATLLLVRYIASKFGLMSAYIDLGVYIWQIGSYLLSPLLLHNAGRVAKNSSYERAEAQWKQAQAMDSIHVGALHAGKVVWWGPAGLFTFAPAMWKMQWSGKTVIDHDSVRMLEFAAIQRIPTPRFALPVIGDAFVGREHFEGKTSLAFCYKYLPIIDHLRVLDDTTYIGKMVIGTETILYFTVTTVENEY